MRPVVASFFDPQTSTVTHIVHSGPGTAAAVIDPVLDFDPKSGRTGTVSTEAVAEHIEVHRLGIEWLLETHAHADHLSGAPRLQMRFGGAIGIGEHIRDVQHIFKDVFNVEPEFATDGSQFDRLFADGDRFRIGGLEAEVLHVPGHTPADVAFLIGDALFVGDTMFMPDVGTARADFPGGDAVALHRSIRRLLALPGSTRIFVCHDYPPKGRAPSCETTVAEQRRANVHVRDGITEEQFVAMRTARDKTLEMPTLILPAIQVNMRAGHMPPAEDNGVTYLKIPVDRI